MKYAINEYLKRDTNSILYETGRKKNPKNNRLSVPQERT